MAGLDWYYCFEHALGVWVGFSRFFDRSGVTKNRDTGMRARTKPFYLSLSFQVALAIVLGGTVGYCWPSLGESMKPLGDGFIKLVKMIIAPVIFLTIVTGIAGVRDLGRVGRVAAKAFAYFLTVSTLALIIGLIAGGLVKPGAGLNIDPMALDPTAVAQYTLADNKTTLVELLMSMIPDTLLSALTSGNVLQVLLVSMLFGIGLALSGKAGERVLHALSAVSDVVFRLVRIIMLAAPVGTFGAFAFTIGVYGIDSTANMASLIGTFYVTAAVFVFLVLGIVARFSGFSVLRLIRYLREELLLVLGTSSSEAALPGLMEKLERAGAGKSVVGLVVPTGYSFNLAGTNIYMTLAALFIAQAMNIDLSVPDQLVLLCVAILSSKGAAGVTGSGFIVLAATLAVIPAVPVAGMALILGIDRLMSECRALTNFIGNAVATLVVSRWEGALDQEALHRVLNGQRGQGAPIPVANSGQDQPRAVPVD